MLHVRFPKVYAGFACLAAADLVFTMKLLAMGGGESNPIADVVHRAFGAMGMGVLKLSSVAAVVFICEVIARARPLVALRLGVAAVVVTAVPVAMGGTMLASAYTYLGGSFDGSGLMARRAKEHRERFGKDEVPAGEVAPVHAPVEVTEDKFGAASLAEV